jgi:hypothetical protein
MSTKSPECYTTEPQASCLRVEISTGRIYLLPLDQLAFAEMDTDGEEQLLHLSFAMHEIMVRGNTLRRIPPAGIVIHHDFAGEISFAGCRRAAPNSGHCGHGNQARC